MLSDDKENAGLKNNLLIVPPVVKKDFFGRVIVEKVQPLYDTDGNGGDQKRGKQAEAAERKVWVTFHEGLNNAVRKPLTLEEFLRGL